MTKNWKQPAPCTGDSDNYKAKAADTAREQVAATTQRVAFLVSLPNSQEGVWTEEISHVKGANEASEHKLCI